MSKKFQKNVENFVCEHCGFKIQGNGFTNHCPKCLWSKHVDIYPGDREANCGGLMKPQLVEKNKSNYILSHICIKCGYKKRNKISPDDDFNQVIIVSSGIQT